METVFLQLLTVPGFLPSGMAFGLPLVDKTRIHDIILLNFTN